MKHFSVYLLLALFSNFIKAQDSLSVNPSDAYAKKDFKYSNLILPGAMITTGAVLKIKSLEKNLQRNSRKLYPNNFRTRIDDKLQYVPFVLIFSGNFLGFKSKNSYMQMGKNTLISSMITGGIVFIGKKSFRNMRPDNSARNSFPSGHSALAFNLATIQFLEYKDSNIWYASSGFLFAGATALMRVANNRHWNGDILTGSGIGIGVAMIVDYWNPFSKVTLNTSNKRMTFTGYPVVDENHCGFGILMSIN